MALVAAGRNRVSGAVSERWSVEPTMIPRTPKCFLMEETMPTVAEAPAPREKSARKRMVVRGEELLGKVRELIHEGNARRIIVIGDDGRTLLEIPLTAGIVGSVMAPALVAVGAIAALATNYTLLIEARSPKAR
jgi:hypothetical protein